MRTEEKDAFVRSRVDIQKLHDNAQDLVGRLTSALGSTDSIKLLKKSDSLQPIQKNTIDRHIKQVDELQKPTKTLQDNALKFDRAAPDDYANLKALLDKHASFFKNAEKFKTKGTALRQDMNKGGKFFYSKPLANVHMTVIDTKIKDILVSYQKILLAYEKYKPYGPFK
jgi:hypothetical protein